MAEYAEMLASGNLFVVGSNPAIGVVKFFVVIKSELGLGLVLGIVFFPIYRQNSKFPGTVWRYFLPE